MTAGSSMALRRNMARHTIHRLTLLLVLLCVKTSIAFGQAQSDKAGDNDSAATRRALSSFSLLGQASRKAPRGFSLMPPGTSLATTMSTGPNLPVLGNGTIGRLTKWTSFSSSNSIIGNSTIFENKDGLVGIGTDSPTSKLTVAGLIQTTVGGFKFPDGSVQTSAGITSIPVPLILTGSVLSTGFLGASIIGVSNSATLGAGIEAIGGA